MGMCVWDVACACPAWVLAWMRGSGSGMARGRQSLDRPNSNRLEIASVALTDSPPRHLCSAGAPGAPPAAHPRAPRRLSLPLKQALTSFRLGGATGTRRLEEWRGIGFASSVDRTCNLEFREAFLSWAVDWPRRARCHPQALPPAPAVGAGGYVREGRGRRAAAQQVCAAVLGVPYIYDSYEVLATSSNRVSPLSPMTGPPLTDPMIASFLG